MTDFESVARRLACEMQEEGRASMRRIEERLGRLADDLFELKLRMASVDTLVAAINNRAARMELRLERIERRLDSVES